MSKKYTPKQVKKMVKEDFGIELTTEQSREICDDCNDGCVLWKRWQVDDVTGCVRIQSAELKNLASQGQGLSIRWCRGNNRYQFSRGGVFVNE